MAINQRVFKSLIAVWLCLPMVTHASEHSVSEAAIEEALKKKSAQFRLLSNEQSLELEQAFAELLRADSAEQLDQPRQSLQDAGFGWQYVANDVVMLTDEQENGFGHYLFRVGNDSRLMLQAPHQFYDRHTGSISIDLFLQSDAKVLAMNSAHRRLDIRDRSGVADIAHLDRTVFSPLTRAFALSHPGGVVLQLHGFAAQKRASEAGRTADVIVSSGQRWLQPVADQFAACLSDVGGWEVRRYPLDIGELGGTTNNQGAELRRLGNNRFVHLELSRDLRDELVAGGESFAFLKRCMSSLGSSDS